jgi:plasmid maintenance system antidote protein VapI
MSDIYDTPIPGAALLAALVEVGKSKADLACALGVDVRAVRYWISGERSLQGAAAVGVRAVLEKWGKEEKP